MASQEQIEDAFRIIAEAVSVDVEELQDHETWKYHGLNGLLATATASDITKQAKVNVPDDVFDKYPTVGALKTFLHGGDNTSSNTTTSKPPTSTPPATPPVQNEDPWHSLPKPKVPLSVTLQGTPQTASQIIFLFPDGSGAGTSYGTLPPLGDQICLIALNSPFLRQANHFTCTVEHMARLWLDEVLRLQPRGTRSGYVLGGWSAGGYYSYEVAKLLVAAGEKMERLILIDSPCRLRYEALPEAVVAELTRKGLMGASGAAAQKKAPEWLVQHFTQTVRAVEGYAPRAMLREKVPAKVDFVWVREGLVESVAESGLEVDLRVKVTRFLLEPRGELQTEGWEELVPGARYSFAYMTGNHFQITQPPHSDSLGRILSGVLKN